MTTETNEQAIVAAARALVPFLVEGWDEQDDLADQAEANAACDALIAAVRAAPAAPSQDALDAERYRWLRGHINTAPFLGQLLFPTDKVLDAAINAAIREEKK